MCSVVDFLKSQLRWGWYIHLWAGITVASAVKIQPDAKLAYGGQFDDKAKAIHEMVQKANKEL